MNRKTNDFYLVFSVWFLLFVLGFHCIYWSSDGFKRLNKTIRKYWYPDAGQIIIGAPDIQWQLNKHFRQIILGRRTSPIFTAPENQAFFMGWDKDFLASQEQALQKILARRERLQQALNPENKAMMISFPEAYRKQRLFVQDIEVMEISDDYLSCRFGNESARLTMRLRPKPLGALYDQLLLRYKIPEDNSPIDCQLSWATENNRAYSGQRSIVFNLSPCQQPQVVAIDFANYYQWLQEDDFTSLLLLFHQEPPGAIDLFSLTLSPSR